MEEELYKIYEYIRDENKITPNISNTKKLILKLLENNDETIEYCIRKSKEEKQEVEDAKLGNHFHKGMTKRQILINEISQYMYWLIIMDISRKIKYKDTEIFEEIKEIVRSIDISKIGENKCITLEEVINHDFENMMQKEYLKNFIKKQLN